MKIVNIYNILSIRESHTKCRMPDKYYLKCTENKKLYLCYGDINRQNSTYGVELMEFGYNALVTEIKDKINMIEKWKLSDLQKAIDDIADLGLISYPNNNPRICK